MKKNKKIIFSIISIVVFATSVFAWDLEDDCCSMSIYYENGKVVYDDNKRVINATLRWSRIVESKEACKEMLDNEGQPGDVVMWVPFTQTCYLYTNHD